MSYLTDLTDAQWTRLAPLFAQAPGRGRRRRSDTRAVLNALLYRLRTGCQWRLLPREYPDWRLVYYYFTQWTRSGLLEQVQATLRAEVRPRQGQRQGRTRYRHPSAAIIDSQSTKGTSLTYASGFDGGKKVKGRKRHLLVDTLGNLLTVQVHPADIADGVGAVGVLTQAQRLVPMLCKLWADRAYGTDTLATWLADHWPRLELGIVRRTEGTTGFVAQPRRWVVERSFAWLGLNRL